MPTLSALQSSGARVFWRCDECGASGDVDLARVMAEAGDLDLTDRHPPCRRCTYWVRFYAQDGQRTWALTTEAGDWRESDRRTEWLRLQAAASAKGPADRAPGE